ncbi:MAG: PQQ-binding-like beta-propeller repeat protein [Bacteroidales bacterium]|jgi:outer membrane protein assembly factor BamB/predicted phosphodiesterase|nr:PQQ-binding-like beta-propeller repeat protein [Bacteroidales bacterium]
MKRLIYTLLFVSLLCSCNKGSFRFALLTDLHISEKSSAAQEDLANAVEQINRTKGLGFVIVSGDITENGDRRSLQTAKTILDRLNIPYYITPGNHDTKWSESGATDFADIYGSDYFRFEYRGFLFLGFNTGPVIRMAEGHVTPQDLNRLAHDLEQWGKKKPAIITTHYPLQKDDTDNWYEATDLLRTYNIRAVLGGHHHADKLCAYDGIPAFINRSTLRGSEPAGGYTVFEITGDSILAYRQITGASDLQRRGGYSLGETRSAKDVVSYERPDYSLNAQYPFVEEVWQCRLDAAVYASPVEADGYVYIGDDTGVFSCIDARDGKLAWQYRTGNRIVGTAAVSDGRVVFGSTDRHIYCLNAADGALQWKVAAQEAVLGAATVADGVAYIGASDHIFRAIDLHSGKEIWQYDGISGYVETRPLLYGGKVIFGAWDNYLYALRKTDGTLLWKWNGNHTRLHFSPAAVWPVATGGKVFIAAPDRALTAIDLQTGEEVWRTRQSTVRETVGLSADSARVFSKTMNDSLVCFSAKHKKVKKVWATFIGYGYEFAPSMPQEKDGVVFCSTMKGEVFAVESLTGKLLWRRKVSNSLVNTVFPLSSDRCLYSCTNGVVALLSSEKK